MDALSSNDEESSHNSDDKMASDDDSIKSDSQPCSKRIKRENSSWSGKRKKASRSALLVHYNEADDKNRAHCKYCRKMISCAFKNGSAPLKNHIRKCKKLSANMDKKEKMLDFNLKTAACDDEDALETNPVPLGWKFDQKAARKALVKLIIVEELHFNFVEKVGFCELMKLLNPVYEMPSRSEVIRDCYDLYLEEKKRLKDTLSKLSSRVSLTTKVWKCGQDFDYMCLTAHYIDDDFVLHRKIINFCSLASYSGQLIGRTVGKCLADWGIKNIMAVTVDNDSSDDLAIDYLKRRLNNLDSSILNGKYLHIRCVGSFLNVIVKDGLKEMEDSISKVRHLVWYVRSSPARSKRFKACVEEEGLESKHFVYFDFITRWDSTFLMLQSALKFKKAFDNLLMKDRSCIEESIMYAFQEESITSGGVPTDEDWTKISSFLPIFKVLHDATLVLSSSRYVTCNDHVHNVFAVGLAISNCCKHEDEGCQKMAQQMKLKYDKYWSDVSNINYLLFIALLLDPRRKMKFVNWLASYNFDDAKAKIVVLSVKMLVSELFECYASSLPQVNKDEECSSSAAASSSNTNLKASGGREIIDFAKLLHEEFEKETGTGENKTELDKYLEDPCESDVSGFSVLPWWKTHQKRYPILSRMARDVLAIPISTVASVSCFDTKGPVLNPFRTSLTPKMGMVEALICAKDWIVSNEASVRVEDNFLAPEQTEGDCHLHLFTRIVMFIFEIILISLFTYICFVLNITGMDDLAMEHEHPEMLIDETLGDWGDW